MPMFTVYAVMSLHTVATVAADSAQDAESYVKALLTEDAPDGFRVGYIACSASEVPSDPTDSPVKS